MKLDIVIPIFNEKENLNELFSRLRDVCSGLEAADWRVIYVNDGSMDGSLQIMLEQVKNNSHFSVIDLSRNFGHQAAITAGLANTDGDVIVLMDGDLQDPPELIPDLMDKWKNGAQVVLARRKTRSESGIRRLGFETFHKFFNWISDFPVPPNTGIFGVMDRQAVAEINRFTEKNRFLPGLRSWVGFRQDVIYYDRLDRAGGRPKQSLMRLLRYAFDAIFSFSYKPLRLMTGVGVCISAVSFIIAMVFVIKRLAGIEVAQTGFTTLVTLMLFLGGVQLIAIGLLGEYLARTYDEVKQRPLYIINKKYGIKSPDERPGL